MKCPRCAAEVEGRFCGLCGAPLEERDCAGCGASVPAGNNFCIQCGTPVAAAAAATRGVPPGSSAGEPPPTASFARGDEPAGVGAPDRRGWWILAAAVAGGILFLAVPYVWTGWADQGNAPRMPMGQAIGGQATGLPAPGPAPGVDLSTMSPREAADRLFNRVMTALGTGDQAEVESFLPMAIDAYNLVPELNADGHFHLSLLQMAAGDHLAALETAERVLADDPDHLLLLYAAGEAARELGRTDQAREHFAHLLEVYDTEAARDRPEYQEHASFLPTAREAAQDFLGGGYP